MKIDEKDLFERFYSESFYSSNLIRKKTGKIILDKLINNLDNFNVYSKSINSNNLDYLTTLLNEKVVNDGFNESSLKCGVLIYNLIKKHKELRSSFETNFQGSEFFFKVVLLNLKIISSIMQSKEDYKINLLKSLCQTIKTDIIGIQNSSLKDLKKYCKSTNISDLYSDLNVHFLY